MTDQFDKAMALLHDVERHVTLCGSALKTPPTNPDTDSQTGEGA